jgi:hypothetical protein
MVEAGEGEGERDIDFSLNDRMKGNCGGCGRREMRWGIYAFLPSVFGSVLIKFLEKVGCIKVSVVYPRVVHMWVSFPMYEVL